MKAVILAGGLGTRLRPYTTVFPKPMVPIGDRPILEIILRQLNHHGFTDIQLSVGYLAELLRAYLEQTDGLMPGTTIRYIYEKEPTGTAGALRLIDELDDTFLMMNGDVLTTLPYDELLDFHRSKNAALTIATHKKPVKIDLGVLNTDGDEFVTEYIEKPTLDYRVSMGVYILEPHVINLIPEKSYFDFPDLVQKLLDAGKKVAAYPSEHLWLDIGRPEDYEEAQLTFEDRREEFGID
jgi:NDP-sugar pyrophosphorylase family protein